MSTVVGWLLYLSFLAAVIFIGWDQPLKDHFVSKDPAAAITGSTQSNESSRAWLFDKSHHDALAPQTPMPKPAPKSPY